MPLPPGTTFSHYEIRSLLGVGGMGEVYLAYDNRLRRSVALKILSPNLRSDKEWLLRFESEAYAASGLNHPNILTVHEIGSAEIDAVDQTNDTRSGIQPDRVRMDFIATEYIDGESLRQYLNKESVQFREVLDIGVQVSSALAAAHSAGIVHRDIKPENIMVRRDHVVKVLDFGLAKIVKQTIPSEDEPTRAMHKTAQGVVMGTASYLSPEQARGKDVDERSDIWSLGIVLYEMGTGTLPFTGETTNDTIAAILTKELPPLHELHPEFERIVTKSLRKDREERYQVVKDLLLDLKSLKQKVEFEAELERTGSADKKRSGTVSDRKWVDRESSSVVVLGDQQAGTPAVPAEAVPAAVAPTTVSVPAAHPTSSAEYVVNEIKQHKRGVLALVAILLLITIPTVYFLYARRSNKATSTHSASIAVLPFENTGNDPNAEYLSDGISESVINALSQLPLVKVIARSSSFQYKGKHADPQEVAKALGVDAILTGRVSRLGDNLLISVELVNASDKTQLWGEQYNRRATDVLSIPADISREIAQNLRLRLSPGEQQRLSNNGTNNPQAYELFLRASYAGQKGDLGNLRKSGEYLNQAIQLDPNYSRAYGLLAVMYNDMIQANVVSAEEFKPRAAEAARKAVELNDNDPYSHYALAYVKTFNWEWSAAEQEIKRAIELSPNLAAAHYGYSIILAMTKRYDEGLREAKLVTELDPVSLMTKVNLGSAYLVAGRTDEAIVTLQKVLELDRTFAYAQLALGYAYTVNGQYPEAIASYQEAAKLMGEYPGLQTALGVAYAKSGKREKALAILKNLQSSKDPVSPTDLANLNASLGQMDQAYALLEKAYVSRDPQLPLIASDPMYSSLRGDPRYAEIVRRVGLQP